jgi:hypothetical protein
LPIECKRLPIPEDRARDKREYLFSAKSSTGGVQRFKAGHHGASHDKGVMIGYIQKHDIAFWKEQIQSWLQELVDQAIQGWSLEDSLKMTSHEVSAKLAMFQSVHSRSDQSGRKRRGNPAPKSAAKGLSICLAHLWIEMIN